MSTDTEDRKIPNPLYAAAGVGDLAYQQLRKLPGIVAELRGKVQNEDITIAKVDVDKIREAAKRNAAALRESALAAQDKATAVYTDLVARGQQVVRTGRTAGSDHIEKVAELTSDAAVAVAPDPVTEPAATTPADSTLAAEAKPKKSIKK